MNLVQIASKNSDDLIQVIHTAQIQQFIFCCIFGCLAELSSLYVQISYLAKQQQTHFVIVLSNCVFSKRGSFLKIIKSIVSNYFFVYQKTTFFYMITLTCSALQQLAFKQVGDPCHFTSILSQMFQHFLVQNSAQLQTSFILHQTRTALFRCCYGSSAYCRQVRKLQHTVPSHNQVFQKQVALRMDLMEVNFPIKNNEHHYPTLHHTFSKVGRSWSCIYSSLFPPIPMSSFFLLVNKTNYVQRNN